MMARSSTRTVSLRKSFTPNSSSADMAADVAVPAPPTKGSRQRTLTAKQQAIGMFFIWNLL